MELNITLIVFLFPVKFFEKIYNYEITLDEAKIYQTELRILINKLHNDYNTESLQKVKEKNNFLKSARKLFDARKDIDFFEKLFIMYFVPLKQNIIKYFVPLTKNNFFGYNIKAKN